MPASERVNADETAPLPPPPPPHPPPPPLCCRKENISGEA